MINEVLNDRVQPSVEECLNAAINVGLLRYQLSRQLGIQPQECQIQ